MTQDVRNTAVKKEAIMMARVKEACRRNDEPRFFDFCDGAMIGKLIPVLDRSGVNYRFWGGTKDAERKMLCVFPDYLSVDELEWPMMAFRFSKEFPLDHRNVLGELMALGITRECLGDIHVTEDEVQVIFAARLRDYFKNNVSQFKGRRVKMDWFDASEIKTYPLLFKEMSIVAASSRVDGIIGKIWGFSRQDALTYIKQKRLRINYQEIIKNDFHLSEGDVLSLRGKGKAMIAEIGESRTKKGNLRIQVKKYV